MNNQLFIKSFLLLFSAFLTFNSSSLYAEENYIPVTTRTAPESSEISDRDLSAALESESTPIEVEEEVWTNTPPWMEKDTYFEKSGNKLIFGLKNLLLGCTAMTTEHIKYKYYIDDKTGWEGFTIGLAKTAYYMVGGALQAATFFIPANIPDIGEGVLETPIAVQAKAMNNKVGQKTTTYIPEETIHRSSELPGRVVASPDDTETVLSAE